MAKDYVGAKLLVGAGTLAYNYFSRNSGVQTRSKKKSKTMVGTAAYSKSRRSFGRYVKKNAKDAHRRLNIAAQKQIWRWQYVSRFGISGGIQGLYSYTAAGNTNMPIHIFDITSAPENLATGPLGPRMYCVGANNTTGDLYFSPLKAHNAGGGIDPGPLWTEFKEYGESRPNVEAARLKWVDLKMNLYGSYGVPVRYKISLIRVHDELSVIGGLNTDNRQKTLIDSLHHPMKYSNLIGNTGYQKKSYSILRQWNYTVNPLDKSEQYNLNTDTGDENISPHFIEFKAFMKLDRDCRYDWHDETAAINLVGDYPDTNTMQTISNDVHNVVWPSKRLYLVIQASSPKVDTTVDPVSQAMTSTQLQWAGSYDICMRRKFEVYEP